MRTKVENLTSTSTLLLILLLLNVHKFHFTEVKAKVTLLFHFHQLSENLTLHLFLKTNEYKTKPKIDDSDCESKQNKKAVLLGPVLLPSINVTFPTHTSAPRTRKIIFSVTIFLAIIIIIAFFDSNKMCKIFVEPLNQIS